MLNMWRYYTKIVKKKKRVVFYTVSCFYIEGHISLKTDK